MNHDLEVVGSVVIPFATGIAILIKKLINKGKNEAKKDAEINLLKTDVKECKKTLQSQAEEIAELKENQHLLKEEILKDLGDVNSKVSNIQGKLSNLKTT